MGARTDIPWAVRLLGYALQGRLRGVRSRDGRETNEPQPSVRIAALPCLLPWPAGAGRGMGGFYLMMTFLPLTM
ncbi:hypothetical protein [Prevotella dentasini]|uniref:hypothetical protein n=1 Tax=Prevotella dentasini TaxID=589537 RepID=UPI0011DE19FA|nr:hypothetical protein [Prevotella dentasini]